MPAAIRRRYNIKAKTKIEWIDDGHTITVMPIPEDQIRALKGKYQGYRLASGPVKIETRRTQAR